MYTTSTELKYYAHSEHYEITYDIQMWKAGARKNSIDPNLFQIEKYLYVHDTSKNNLFDWKP